jgi:hypothetical protein
LPLPGASANDLLNNWVKSIACERLFLPTFFSGCKKVGRTKGFVKNVMLTPRGMTVCEAYALKIRINFSPANKKPAFAGFNLFFKKLESRGDRLQTS